MAEQNYELVVYDGRPARKYPNGVIRDELGRIRHMPRGVAVAVGQGQKDLARFAAIDGLNEATGKPDYYESIKELIRVRAQMALTDTTRAGNEALRIVLQHTGLGQEKTTTTTVQGVVQHVPVMSQSYWQALKELQEGEVIDGEETE